MNNYKVTIITPAYQAEKYIQSYIDMVLNFDYKNLELILINDASTDKTDEIIRQNEQRIKDFGIEFKYFKLEENVGQAEAINRYLCEVTGDYLTWPDVDDILYPNCISKHVEFCKKHPEHKIVFCKYNLVDGNNSNKIITTKPKHNFKHKNLFIDYIWEKNVIFGPMRFVETEALFRVLKDKSIFPSRGGQNWQLILPMVYFYKWGYIDEVLCDYMLYQDSHCHTKDASSMKRYNLHKEILLNTIERLDIPYYKKVYYKNITKYKYFVKQLNSCFKISINLKHRRITGCIFCKSFVWSFDEK